MTAMIDDSCSRAHGKGERSATAALTPLLDGPGPIGVWVVAAFLPAALSYVVDRDVGAGQ